MALQKTNATVSAARSGVVTAPHVRVFLKAPGPANMSIEGLQVSTTFLADPGTSWHAGDLVTFEVIDGHDDLDQATVRDVLYAARNPGVQPVTMGVQKALISVFVRGVVP